MWLCCCIFCFFKQKTAYEMRISDWSSDVCSSDLVPEKLKVLVWLMTVSFRGGWSGTHETCDRVGGFLELELGLGSAGLRGLEHAVEIGRASCRERVCQYV